MTVAAPAPGQPQPAADTTGGGPQLRLFGLVRDIRAEAQNIVRALDRVRAALALTDPDAQASELKKALVGSRRIVDENAPIVEERFRALRDLVDSSPTVYDQAGDAITGLENSWREFYDAVTWAADASAIDITERLARIDKHLGAIEWQAAVVTVPNRVRQHLKTKRVGGQLRFHDAFRDEIEDEAQRVEVLRYLQQHAASFSGVVDVPSGVIYRIAPKVRRRVLSWVALLALATVIAYVFVYLLCNGFPLIKLSFGGIAGLAPERFPELMGAWWALLFGAVAHLIVEAIKQGQRSDSESFRALEDWFVWVHVRETSLIVGILSLYVILVGLALFSPDVNSLTFLAAFGAGYSFDSILGLFITRFDTSAKSAVEVVTKQFAGTSKK